MTSLAPIACAVPAATRATAGAPSAPAAAPPLTLRVPRAIGAQLSEARTRGEGVARAFLAAHPAGDDAAFAAHLQAKAGSPPDAEAQRRELEVLHRIERARTPEGNAQAVWVDEHGLFDIWTAHFDEWRKGAAPDQAARGAAMLTRAKDITKTVTFALKDGFNRQRPFLSDPTLTVVDGVHHTASGSFPSGHASQAFTEAALLAALRPERARRFARDAVQVSYARPYAGVHFPSDVAAGAFVGAAVGTYVGALHPSA